MESSFQLSKGAMKHDFGLATYTKLVKMEWNTEMGGKAHLHFGCALRTCAERRESQDYVGLERSR